MRKFFWIFVIPAVLLSGCHREESTAVSRSIPVVRELSAEVDAVPEINSADLEFQERVQTVAVPEYRHIYDECQALTQEETAMHNAHLDWLSASRSMNAFLVITDNLNGNSPELFAQHYYQTVADAGVPDGFLLLINNDTNQDYFFTTGRCSTYMTPAEKAVAISGATYSLIEANYTDAFNILFPVAELIPAYVLDHTSTLTDPELQEFSDKLQSIQEEKNIQGALMLLPFPEDMENYQNPFDSDILLLIDPNQKLCSVTGEVPDFSESEFLKIWEEQSLPWAIRYFLNNI